MSAPHVLVLGACTECTPEEHCGNSTCSPAWSIECPGLEEGGCRVYWECRECTAEDRDQLEETEVAHGVEHVYLGYLGWCTPGQSCWVQLSDSTCEAVQKLVEEHDLKAGRYEVDIDNDEDHVLLSLVAP